MVRLKADPLSFPDITFSSFQFHMVRLKDTAHPDNTDPNHVSIPYGTIKSYHSWRKIASFYVSIPYGTIKSGSTA